MKCKGNFVFKSITHKQGGTFKNANGEDISYKPSYVLKVDELGNGNEINERKFKIAEDKTVLINTLKPLEVYTKITLEFNITIYTNSISLELIDVSTGFIDED